MKLFQVDDLYPESEAGASLRLEDVQIFVRGENGALHTKNRPIAAEMWREKTTFKGSLRLDNFWLKSKQAADLQFGPQAEYVTQLAANGRERAAALISTELDFFEECAPERNQDEMYNWYLDLQEYLEKLAENEFFMPLGWSTGWNGKTYAENLRQRADFSQNQPDQQGIRQAFQLGHWQDAASPFPISRKLILNYDKDDHAYAYFPPGWVKVSLTSS
jgi:hypothetical protein